MARAEGAAAVLVMSTCNAATGATLDVRSRRALAELASHGVIIIDDQSLAHYDPGRPLPSIQRMSSHQNIISIGSFNKIYWGGLRIGWISANPRLVPSIVRVKARSDNGVSVPSQLVLETLLPRHQEIVSDRQVRVGITREAVSAQLVKDCPDWRVEDHSVGPSMWIRLPVSDSAKFVEYCYAHDLSIGYGGNFRADGRPSPHIKLALTLPVDVTTELVRQLAGLWRSFAAMPRVVPQGPGAVSENHPEP